MSSEILVAFKIRDMGTNSKANAAKVFSVLIN